MLDALSSDDKCRLRTLIAEAIKQTDGGVAHFHVYVDYADAALDALGVFTSAKAGADAALRSIA